MKRRSLKVLGTLFLLEALLASCATTGPPVTSAEVSRKRSELEAKAEKYRAIQLQRVEAIAKRLISFMPPEDQAKLRNLRYEVSKRGEINAEASWNRIAVSYGMLRFTESDDELASVLAHELAHLARGHIGKSLGTNVLGSALGIAAGAAIEGLTQGSGLGTPVAQAVSQTVAGGFSRDFEREADYYGFQSAYVAGFDISKGAQIWERLAIEAPETLTAGLFSTHPSSPERLIRAEKTLQELVDHGIKPHLFNRPSIGGPAGGFPITPKPSVLQKTVAMPAQAVAIPTGLLSQAVGHSLSAVSQEAPSRRGIESKTSIAGQEERAIKETEERLRREREEFEKEKELLEKEWQGLEKEKEEYARREETLEREQTVLARLREEERKRLAALTEETRQHALEQQGFERILLEAKEASIRNRYEEFGILEMGLAKKVRNLWLGKQVTGNQRIFPLSQGSVDWYCQYGQWSRGSWKALALLHRKYHAYWYAPDGSLFSEQDFTQSKIRSEFAKTTLHWDPALGDRLMGERTIRIFENGKLVDERTFEVVG